MRGVAVLCLLLGALALCAGQITTFLDNNVYSVSECVPKTSAVCNGYANLAVGTLVLIPSNSTEQDQEDFANRRLAAAQILSTVGYPSCQKYIELYWCLRAFVPCEIYQVNATTSVALPMYMCPGVCLNGSAICEEPYRIGGYDLPSCPDVPSYDFSASAGPNNVTANCTNVAASSSPGNLCTVLHEVYYSQSEADRIYDFYRVMGWICLALNVLVLVLHLANPKLRTWPVHLIVAMCISQMLLCLGLLFSTFAKREKLFCEEGALRNLCHAQGGFIFGGLLFAIATWLTLTVTNLVVIVRNDPRRMLRWFQTKWYFVMGYLVVPLVPACLFWANIGTDNSSNSSLLYCSSNKLSPFQNYFVIPVIIFVFLGTLCIIATAVILIKDLKHGLRDFALYARLLIYELVALFPATVLVIPFEYNYPKLKRNDESIFRDGSFKRAVSCITIGSAITPLLFALIFLLKWEHWDFFKEKVGSFTTFTTSGGTSASGSRGGASTSRSDREGDNPEISKF